MPQLKGQTTVRPVQPRVAHLPVHLSPPAGSNTAGHLSVGAAHVPPVIFYIKNFVQLYKEILYTSPNLPTFFLLLKTLDSILKCSTLEIMP